VKVTLQIGIRARVSSELLKVKLQIGIRVRVSSELRKVTLQIGIRAKVSTLSLDGPVECSLDRG
jgi:hypothetical protein